MCVTFMADVAIIHSLGMPLDCSSRLTHTHTHTRARTHTLHFNAQSLILIMALSIVLLMTLAIIIGFIVFVRTDLISLLS